MTAIWDIKYILYAIVFQKAIHQKGAILAFLYRLKESNSMKNNLVFITYFLVDDKKLILTFISFSCSHVSITAWLHHLDLNKILKKKLDRNYTRILCAVLKKFLEAAPYKTAVEQSLPSHQSLQIKWVRYAGHYWWSKNELIRDELYTWTHQWWLKSKIFSSVWTLNTV